MNHDKPDHTRDQIESLIAEVDTLRKERDALEAMLAAARSDIHGHVRAIAGNVSEREVGLKRRIQELESERDKEKWSAIEWHRRHDDAIDARDTTIKELRQQLAMCDSDRTSLEIALEAARASIAQLDAAIADTERRLIQRLSRDFVPRA